MDDLKNPQASQSLMPLGELFSKSFNIYKERVWVLAGLMAINFAVVLVFLFLAAIFLVAAALVGISVFTLSSIKLTVPLIILGGILFLIGLLTAITIGIWTQVSSIYAIKERDAKIGVKESLARGKKKIWQYFWVSILVGLVIALGFILLIIPGILFTIWFSFAYYVLVNEDLKGMQTLKRSKQLVKGNWWNIFFRLLVVGIFVSVIAGIIGMVPFFGVVITTLFVSPFACVFGYLLYEDLKR